MMRDQLIMTAFGFLAAAMCGCGGYTCPYSVDYTTECGLQITIDRSRGPVANWVGTPEADVATCEIAAQVEAIVGVPTGSLAGTQVVWTGAPIEYWPGDGVAHWASGLYHGPSVGWNDMWIEVATDVKRCPVHSALGHELLHAALDQRDGDDNGAHTAVEWSELAAYQSQFVCD